MAQDLLEFVMQDTFAMFIDDSSKEVIPADLIDSLDTLSTLVLNIKYNTVSVQKAKLSEAMARGSDILTRLNSLIGQKISRAQNDFIQRLYNIIAVMKSIQAVYVDSDSVDVIIEKLAHIKNLTRLDINTLEKVLSETNDIDKFISKTLRHGNFSFDNIKGIDSIVKDLKATVENVEFVPTAQFIILTGPPGTGKSVLSRALATAFSNGSFYNFGVGELSSPYIGETEAGIISLFKKLVSSKERATIVLDEFDNIFATEQPHLNSVKTTIQTEIQGSGEPLPNTLLLVAITNFADVLPKAIIRRCTKFIYVQQPSIDDCVNYLINQQMKQPQADPTFVNGIKNLMGNRVFTNANMETWYKLALIEHLENLQTINFYDENNLLSEITPGVTIPRPNAKNVSMSKDQLKRYNKPFVLLPTLDNFNDTRNKFVPMTTQDVAEFLTRNNLSL